MDAYMNVGNQSNAGVIYRGAGVNRALCFYFYILSVVEYFMYIVSVALKAKYCYFKV